jgi:hypothetical protein
MNNPGDIYQSYYLIFGGMIIIFAFVMFVLILYYGKDKRNPITNNNRCLFFVLFSVSLHIIIYNGYSFHDTATLEGAPILCFAPFYIANWPSVLLRIYPVHEFNGQVEKFLDPSYMNIWIVLSNILGWAILGAFIGTLTSGILKWRNRRHVDQNPNNYSGNCFHCFFLCIPVHNSWN